ncbi:ABC transporter substrate-binding protein [Novosphingobium tardum]|uniref:ABC transporter substrate-binding protein n=1 Tax=Novosphingobium tardum TaxID=1538021 RepID=A0ABV8RUM3_9SPHN
MRVVASLALAACLAGCAQPRNEAPRASHGNRPTIVSLNPCSDAILAEVADPGQILAISAYSHDPRASSMDPAVARRFAATGGTVEEVVALDPDLVVASSFLPPASAASFARLGLHVARLPIATDVATSEAQVRVLARLAGHPERGEALVGRIETALAAAAPPPGTRPVSAVVWQAGGLVAGDDSLIAALLAHAGFVNAAPARGLGQGQRLALEDLLAGPPAVLLVAGDTAAREERMLAHPALATLGAARRNLDPVLLYCGGPTIVRAAARLAAIRRELPR